MRLRRHLVALCAALAAIAAALVVSQPQPVAAATGGTIKIIVTAKPSAGQDFGFTGCQGQGCTTFRLDDDSTTPLPPSLTATDLAAGTYTITQDAVPGWTLTSLACTSGGAESIADLRATITLTEGKTVTCIFTDQSPSITIEQDTSPDSDLDFAYTGCLGAGCSSFTLDDDADPTLPNAVSGAGLAPGTYTITESPNGQWPLGALTCSTTTGITRSVANRRVTIVLTGPTDHRTCTFKNVTQSLTIIDDDLAASGQDHTFTGCASGGCSTFSLDDDGATDATLSDRLTGTTLATGTYTITQADVPGHELTDLVCPNETVDLLARRATVTLTAGEDRTCTFTNRPILPPLSGIEQISTGEQHTCALLTTGQARCWGRNSSGQLGNGTYVESMSPVVVRDPSGSGPLTGIARLSAGWARTCALLDSGQAVCWGQNGHGQLGNGTTGNANLPVEVRTSDGLAPLDGITQIDARGSLHTCATIDDGGLLCWGRNQFGQLGDGTAIDRGLPTPVITPDGSGPLAEVAAVASGYYHGCALLESGEVRCWGLNVQGALGDGTTVASTRPVIVKDPSGAGPLTGIDELSASFALSCARHDDGQASCWGQTPEGGGSAHPLPIPITTEDGTTPRFDVVAIEAGYLRFCILATDAMARCAGAMHGSAGSSSTKIPVPVAGIGGVGTLSDVASLSGTFNHTCALLQIGEARCWGYNYGAVLGDGTSTDRSFPVTVLDPAA